MSDITKIGDYLEANGWKREIAGVADFDAACKAIKIADEYRIGLLVSGTFGAGKTMLTEIVARQFAHHWHRGYRKIFMGKREDVEKLDREWRELWGEDIHDEVVLLDDVGAETSDNDYGIITEKIATFLTERHDRLMRYANDWNIADLKGGARAASDGDKPRYYDLRPETNNGLVNQKGVRAPFPMVFVTTNLNVAQFDDRYNGRVSSRNKDMFVPLRLTGDDKRQWKKTNKTSQTH